MDVNIMDEKGKGIAEVPADEWDDELRLYCRVCGRRGLLDVCGCCCEDCPLCRLHPEA